MKIVLTAIVLNIQFLMYLVLVHFITMLVSLPDTLMNVLGFLMLILIPVSIYYFIDLYKIIWRKKNV
jgi:hypothetical protein